ncbi:MAG: hypothetical protein Q4F71_08770 [Paracoccus sp. (in: a-proteobacteria)]|nr:hypothetical protein [Paracoccus sp. (in: a-proteobacteria)]
MSNDNTKTRHQIGRRGFFGAAAGAVAAGAGAGLIGGSASPAFATEPLNERTRARYQVTEHVETFYRVNRYYRGGE